MRVVIAPDSFKDALSAAAASAAIARGVRSVSPHAEVIECPIADGGEGFAETLAGTLKLREHRVRSFDALHRPAEGRWFGDGRTAVLELAECSGLPALATRERNPERTSTFGTGVLLRAAISAMTDGGVGASPRSSAARASGGMVLLGIGGSATNDGGCGLVQAMGGVFRDPAGEVIATPIRGADLSRIASVELDAVRGLLREVTLRAACDVINPLCGPRGAAHVYGPQKGADAAAVQRLDAGLRSVAEVWRATLGVDVTQLPGAGAAGGVGGGLLAMLGAELVPGAELVLDAVGFDEHVRGADLVFTGEGRLDGQSLEGKAVMTVVRRAAEAGVPTVALVGSVGDDPDAALRAGLHAYRVIGAGLPREESIARCAALLEQHAAAVVRGRS